MGWQTAMYRLAVDDLADEGGRYTIGSDSEYSGGDTRECADDPDEIECWIQERVEGAEG